jgi:hypothetical protein
VDDLQVPVYWGSPEETIQRLSRLKNREVAIEFRLQNARLYSFDVR